ncbi:MAG: lysophospholipase [Woeseia sp.]|nr:lysophospholipase [Woeseia sp.]
MNEPRGTLHESISLAGKEGHAINVSLWQPTGTNVQATVQILHGLAEHADRYQRFAEFLTSQGFAVIAHNHRGHGATLEPRSLGHFADKDGWQKVLDDVRQVQRHIDKKFPSLPRLLIGHSMGSYIAQAFIMQHPDACDALVLSGSTAAPRLQLYLGRFAARIEIWRHGKQHRSTALNAQAFGAYNKRFAPARTDFDWLSRDPVEVDRYVNDRACGFVPSAGLWHDLLGGLIAIGKKKSLRKIPEDLPILITGGSDDPVGGRAGMQRLYKSYQRSGHDHVTLKIYEGGRHEMLNEINYDEVMHDIVRWAAGEHGRAVRSGFSRV